MPQFELDAVGPAATSGLTRGRDAADAVRRAAALPPDADVSVDAHADAHGWQCVRIAGVEAGRIRLHGRMRFRRD
ncbi:MAG: hypothetical protein ACK41D_10205 [Rubricoccaceae bacterium]